MKSIFLFLSTIISLSVFAQNPHNILRHYKNNDNVMTAKFEGDMLNIFRSDENNKIKSTLEYMDIIVFKEGTDISEKDKSKLDKSLIKENYELLVNVVNKQYKVKIMGLDNGDTLSKVYINANMDKANVYIVAQGSLYFDELKNLDLSNLEELLN